MPSHAPYSRSASHPSYNAEKPPAPHPRHPPGYAYWQKQPGTASSDIPPPDCSTSVLSQTPAPSCHDPLCSMVCFYCCHHSIRMLMPTASHPLTVIRIRDRKSFILRKFSRLPCCSQ